MILNIILIIPKEIPSINKLNKSIIQGVNKKKTNLLKFDTYTLLKEVVQATAKQKVPLNRTEIDDK